MHWIIALFLVLALSIPAPAQQVTRSKVTLTTVSVGAASGAALAANEDRNFLMLQNDHATQVVYCTTGATATLNNGIRVNAVGGTIIFSPIVPLGALVCIATGATTPLLITEGARQ